MNYSAEYHLNQLYKIVNPESRAAYYCKHIDTKAIDLSTAENVLLMKFYQKHIFNGEQCGGIDQSVIRYPVEYGSDAYRESIAELLKQSWGVENLDKDDVFAVSGVSAALECLSFSLFQKGDGAIFPAPLWYGFPWCLVDRPGMNFYPFQVEKQRGSKTKFELSLEDIRRAYNDTVPSPKVLVLTNPNNPLGVNYSKELLEEIYHWILNSTDMHIISDEIYGFSQVNRGDQKEPFRSALTLDAYKDASPEKQRRVHVVWGLAKDFGLSGFKVGFVISKNNRVKRAMKGVNTKRSMSWFSPFNSLTQHMLKPLFLDQKGNADPSLALKAMKKYSGVGGKGRNTLLTKQFNLAEKHLRDGGIDYIPQPNAAIFFWLDLRKYLEPNLKYKEGKNKLHPMIDPQEDKLTADIREKAKLLLIPGMECYNKTPGFFRLCYTAQNGGNVAEGIDRLADYLSSR